MCVLWVYFPPVLPEEGSGCAVAGRAVRWLRACGVGGKRNYELRELSREQRHLDVSGQTVAKDIPPAFSVRVGV